MKIMSEKPEPERHLPSRAQALVFEGKACLLRLRRSLSNIRNPLPKLGREPCHSETEPLGSASSELWTHQSDAEFPLTAGKIQNLRVACAALNGTEVPANATFSFWKQLGRTSAGKGYVDGRELREGCLIPSIGGGLCQLSNMLYSAALDAGLDIVERHAHSRTIPGSLAEKNRDATVFWNYVDLRFRAPFPFRLETVLTGNELSVRIFGKESVSAPVSTPRKVMKQDPPTRSAPSGDCLACGMTSCFRNPAATDAHYPDSGHCAFLLDEFWPEFQTWCSNHSEKGDHWLLPLDGDRWNKRNYAWSVPEHSSTEYATIKTLYYSYKMRRIPSQGATRQNALLRRDIALSKHYGRQLDPAARHLIVSQNLLPHLWRDGHLGGRTFDVLMTRWPMKELQHRLDEAASAHPNSPTLSDFRAEPEFSAAEEAALNTAARIITPHRAVAEYFGSRALLLDWEIPEPDPESIPKPGKVFFPASPLGRKGIYELAEALQSPEFPNLDLVILGPANEAEHDPLKSIPHRKGSLSELKNASVLVIPAWIEHQPRLALQALSNGITVISTRACGLPHHPQLVEIEKPDSRSVFTALRELLIETQGSALTA